MSTDSCHPLPIAVLKWTAPGRAIPAARLRRMCEITFDTLKFSDGKDPVAATVQAIQTKLSREDGTPTVGLGAPTRAMGGTNNGVQSEGRCEGAIRQPTAAGGPESLTTSGRVTKGFCGDQQPATGIR